MASIITATPTFVITFTPEPPSAGTTTGIVSLNLDCYRSYFDPTTKTNLRFQIKVHEWREKILTEAKVINTPNFENLALPLNYATIIITIKGTIYGPHPPHPIATNVEHNMDFLDLEEAALLWNRGAIPPAGEVPILPTLTLHLPASNRVYSGLITKLFLIEEGGTDQGDFIMEFRPKWNIVKPLLREWNTAPP